MFTINGQSASQSWCQARLWSKTRYFLTVRQLRVCTCEAPSLTRVQMCRLQLLLVIAGEFIRVSGSLWTHNHILLPQILHSPTWMIESPGNGWPSYYPKHQVPFTSPPSIHRPGKVFSSGC
jgi:hypothetical protein